MPTHAVEGTARLQRLRAMPRPETWPTYETIAVDPSGRLWVRDYTTARPAPIGWTAFDASGRLIGRLVIPAPREGEMPLQFITFGTDHVIVRRFDEDRATYLTVYPLQRVR